MIDGLNDTAHDTAPWRRILNADRRGWVLIGECTSDTGVHVHRNVNSMCAPALPYVAGCLTVAARPPERRRRSGALGRRWERPPPSGCLVRHRRVCTFVCTFVCTLAYSNPVYGLKIVLGISGRIPYSAWRIAKNGVCAAGSQSRRATGLRHAPYGSFSHSEAISGLETRPHLRVCTALCPLGKFSLRFPHHARLRTTRKIVALSACW